MRLIAFTHRLAVLLILGPAAFGTLAHAEAQSAPATPQFTFDQYELVLGSAARQTVLAGHLLGGEVADLAVLSIDDNGERRLHVYSFGSDAWESAFESTLDPESLFVDIADIGGRDRLVAYAPGRLSWFDVDTRTQRDLVSVTADFRPPRTGEVPHVDITRDVNRDGRDDLVVPGSDGFRVFVQTSGGAFADPLKVGPPADLSGIYGAGGYRYDPWSQGRIYEIDYNQDERVDLLFWAEDHFEAHLQDDRGLFAVQSTAFTTEVPFDTDNPSWLATGDMAGRVLHSLADLNGDGVGDMVIFSLQGEDIADKSSAYEIHPGRSVTGGRTVFSPEVGATFQSDHKIQLGLSRHDFDGDGQVDLMLTTIAAGYLEPSFFKRVGRKLRGQSMSFGVMGDDVWLDLEFYRLDSGTYPDEPDATRRIAFDGSPSNTEPGWVPIETVLRGATHESLRAEEMWPRAFNRTLLIGDVTGDGRADLLIEKTHRGLNVFAGVPGPGLFADNDQAVTVAVPNDGEYSRLVDLNGDGTQDVLLHHPFTQRNAHGAPTQPPGTEPHRLIVLIAR